MVKVKSIATLLAMGLMCGPSWAVGPDKVAQSDRSLWPDLINSPEGFDRASRAEIMVFAAAFTDVADKDEPTLKASLHINSVDVASVLRVRNRLLDYLVKNYQSASKRCATTDPFCPTVNSSQSLIAVGRDLPSKLPESYQSWYDNAQAFHSHYANELIRLAALFPKVTSEVDTFSAKERSGFELPDRHFLLTFDDGPTNALGNTDVLLKILNQQKLHAMFYVLGERLKARAQTQSADGLQAFYSGQCIALHGWQHQSHQRWEQWQTSVLDTQQLVRNTFAESYRPFFRPPYGQRRSDSEGFFGENQLTVALWNIDSLDWSSKVGADEAKQRVLTLMLLWRRGVILFHDIHVKAQAAVPWLLTQTNSAGVNWDDCHSY